MIGSSLHSPPPAPPGPEQELKGYVWPSSRLTRADMIRLTELRKLTRKPITKLIHEAVGAYCDQLQSQNQKPGDDKCVPPDLAPLAAPVPSKLAEVFGYAGQARFVGFYHEPTVDELIYDDGHTSATGGWYAFERWREHPTVAVHLQDVNLGDAELDATHWLIIDRDRDVLYVARVSTAQLFLQEQHPRLPELQPSEMAEIHRRMEMQQIALAKMLAFLDTATAATQDSPPKPV